MRIAKTRTRGMGLLTALAAALMLLTASSASASVGPRLEVGSISNTTVAPGEILNYKIQITNAGDEPLDGSPVKVAIELPPGLVVADPAGPAGTPGSPYFIVDNGIPLNYGFLDVEAGLFPCTQEDDTTPLEGGESVAHCENSAPVEGARPIMGWQLVSLPVEAVGPGLEEGDVLTTEVSASGGGSPPAVTADPVRVSASPPGFDVDGFDAQAIDAAGQLFNRAGAHPEAYVTDLDLTTTLKPQPLNGPFSPVAAVRDIVTELPVGFLGDPTVAAQCTAAQLAHVSATFVPKPLCPVASQVGTSYVKIQYRPPYGGPYALYNMVPRPGSPARFGFAILGTTIVLDASLRSESDYGLRFASRNIPAALAVSGSRITVWGTPGDPSHDYLRACPGQEGPDSGGPSCPGTGAQEAALLRMPTACGPAQSTPVHVDSWQEPGAFAANALPDLADPRWHSSSTYAHEAPGFPYPQSMWGAAQGIEGCEDVPVEGTLSARPTSRDAETASGLQVHVEVPTTGLEDKNGVASSDLKKVKVSLPAGLTINPSQAEGLGVCTPAQFESTELSFQQSEKGCPEDSKIGTVEVHTPLLEETIPGDVYIAQQDDPSTPTPGAENPFDSLLAIYVVLAEPQRGVLVKLPAKVETDPTTGRIVTTFEDLPQQPFSSFDFKFREGARAPLVTPSHCGTYSTEAEITGWSHPDGPPIISKSSFTIDRGIGGGPCPPAGIPPFKPGFNAGSINNNAGSYSPFYMRLTRKDGEQDLTKFSALLPPGVSAKLAGVAKCPEAAIQAAAAKSRTGRQELAAPSCPANSQIGHTLAGAGVGSVLTYVPGKLYLAGPWQGAPLSVVAITPAVAGPFDVGTVVVREALTLDPVTAEVHVDGDKSDPIPHILEGIPLKLRDLRVYVDRQSFTINPTSCDPSRVGATMFGSYADVFNPADDVPVALSSRYQAANCLSLGFKPTLKINLEGGMKRGGHPALRAVVVPRPGDANIEAAVVKLPRSAFLEQAHIRTICTRVQFAQDACPKGAIYGHVRAFTPLLDEPLEGPVYLRSSDHKLPDLVFALRGIVDIEAAGRIDSVNGGIRTSFEGVPDAPISRVILEMQGGKKGLIVNSRDLCAGKGRAHARFTGQNGKVRDFRPVVRAECAKKRKPKR
jgi:hypothetical protein